MPRPLPTLPVLLLAFGALAALEAGVRASYTPPRRLAARAAEWAATPEEGREVVILGTCLPEQYFQADDVEATLGGGWQVVNLGSSASSALDWYLAFARHLPERRVDALVLGYADGDLTATVDIWESQTLELAGWRDVPDLARMTCADAGCAFDLVGRRISAAWRFRERLANRAWATVGIDTVPPPPSSVPGQGAGDRGRPPAPGLPTPGAAPTRGAAATPPVPLGAPPDGEAGPLRYLAALFAEAKARGVPVVLLPLPTRPGSPPKGSTPRVDAAVRESGATVLRLPSPPASDFEDDTHLHPFARRDISRALGEALRDVLPR